MGSATDYHRFGGIFHRDDMETGEVGSQVDIISPENGCPGDTRDLEPGHDVDV